MPSARSAVQFCGKEVRCGPTIERPLREFSGATVTRIIHMGEVDGEEHRHDWPILSIYVMGSYVKLHDSGATPIAGPSIVLHPANSFHANRVAAPGMEQIDIQFDPKWLGARRHVVPLDRLRCWIGGSIAIAARSLVSACNDSEAPERALASGVIELLDRASRTSDPAQPAWLACVAKRMDDEYPVSTVQLASELGLHPAWLARAYRTVMGEGLQDTQRRKRVERAARLMRATDWPAAEVAIAAGFCDQSHMIRSFSTVLARTPNQVRRETRARP